MKTCINNSRLNTLLSHLNWFLRTLSTGKVPPQGNGKNLPEGTKKQDALAAFKKAGKMGIQQQVCVLLTGVQTFIPDKFFLGISYLKN